jgi:uncharacterized membrane protein YfhO
MAPVKESLKVPGAIEFLQRDTGLHRVYGLIPNKYQDDYSRFFPNYNMYFRISDVGAYSPLVMNDYRKFMENLGGVDDSIWRLEPSIDALSKDLNHLSLLNVKYIVTYEEIKDKRVELAYSDEQVNVYRNNESLPRAFFLSNFKVISDGQEALGFLRSKDFNPKDIVVLDKEPVRFKNGSDEQHNNASVEIKDYSPAKVILNIIAPSNGILVLSDTFYPGWKAHVDQEETEIMKANTVMRAIIIPKGEHLVIFVFVPVPFNYGLRLGLCTLVGVPIMIFVSSLTKLKKR